MTPEDAGWSRRRGRRDGLFDQAGLGQRFRRACIRPVSTRPATKPVTSRTAAGTNRFIELNQVTSTARAALASLGIVTVSRPSLRSALMLSTVMGSGRVNAREKGPWRVRRDGSFQATGFPSGRRG